MANSQDKLRSFLQEIATKENYTQKNIDIKPITSGGANYTTDLYLATITEPLKPDINIFAKVANLNEDARESNEILSKVYVTEGLFYTKLADNFERIYNKNNVPADDRLGIAKFYGHVLAPFEETMVLENLEARGFKNFDRMKTFDWEYAAVAVTQMAKFHALGFAFRDESPEEFEGIVSNFDIDLDSVSNQEMMQAFMKQGIEFGCEAINDINDYKLRLQKFFSNTENLMMLMTRFTQDRTVLVHGDFRPSNLMHRRRNGKLEIIPLDYQTLRMGNPVFDLMHFIFSGSDEEFRRFHYRHLLDHYFAQLTLSLKALNLDVDKVYPRKTFDNDMLEFLPLGLTISLTIVGVVTVNPEEAPTLSGDIASSMTIKPNELAKERIRGIIKDFVRWGVL